MATSAPNSPGGVSKVSASLGETEGVAANLTAMLDDRYHRAPYSEARERDDETAFRSGVDELTSAILEHVQIEESHAFPLLESAGQGVLSALAHQIVEFRGTLTSA